ncbi:NADH dehydrogenase [ubiquinone] 1 beta subcomplex subunit 7, partial [Herpailurus yagouaroundi]|uniref:NADH dehydrogenase [ubiquinone] 1 beta subcomplex subunit 7 n=1 Tax=Herpailurus yagouaroundi TaxID=1608482 RepID=UPI001AD61B32
TPARPTPPGPGLNPGPRPGLARPHLGGRRTLKGPAGWTGGLEATWRNGQARLPGGRPSFRPGARCQPASTCSADPRLKAATRRYVMRMKEFERERRLLQRKKRREQRAADVAQGQGPGEVAPEVAL